MRIHAWAGSNTGKYISATNDYNHLLPLAIHLWPVPNHLYRSQARITRRNTTRRNQMAAVDQSLARSLIIPHNSLRSSRHSTTLTLDSSNIFRQKHLYILHRLTTRIIKTILHRFASRSPIIASFIPPRHFAFVVSLSSLPRTAQPDDQSRAERGAAERRV